MGNGPETQTRSRRLAGPRLQNGWRDRLQTMLRSSIDRHRLRPVNELRPDAAGFLQKYRSCKTCQVSIDHRSGRKAKSPLELVIGMANVHPIFCAPETSML